jgi:hypothetical protein
LRWDEETGWYPGTVQRKAEKNKRVGGELVNYYVKYDGFADLYAASLTLDTYADVASVEEPPAHSYVLLGPQEAEI